MTGNRRISPARTIPGHLVSPSRIVYTYPNGEQVHGAVDVRNGIPQKPYRRDNGDQAAIVERVCRWRRSLIAAAMVLQLAAEQAGE